MTTIHTKLGREKNMKQNIGNTDRIVRVVLAAVMLVTSAVGFCPLYAPFGFTTKPRAAKS
ncbi:MAG TPA: DUF2892 domain-containing protein [Propionicimonas sp.]